MSLSFGADPELLLTGSGERGKFVSVEGLVGGTKGAPIPIPEYADTGCGMQEDNVMLEFNVTPQSSGTNLLALTRHVLAHLTSWVENTHGLAVSARSSGEYGPDQLNTAQAVTFGCSPDRDAYTRNYAPLVSPDTLGNWRCAGGHIHVGYSNEADVPTHVIVQLLDAYCGLFDARGASVRGETVRSKSYGSAGRYREKSYGLEYRTPSNRWLFDTSMGAHMLHGVEYIAKLVDRGDVSTLQRLYSEIPVTEVQVAINSGNLDDISQLQNYIQEVS
jgi:hypothetical protein